MEWLALFVALGLITLGAAGFIEGVLHWRQRQWVRRLKAMQDGRMRQARAE